jgi:Domain of unknown function (DUF4388)
MRGNLSDFNVESLLQVLGTSRATGALQIAHPTGRQFIAYLVSGKLVHAEYDTDRGVDALAALMLEQSGTFEFKHGLETDQRTIQGAAEWTLMSAMNQADTRPPALRSEVTIKRKTGNASLNASTPGALGRATRPADSATPRTLKPAAGSDTTKLEALETMLKSSVFNLNLGGSKPPQKPSHSLNVSPPTGALSTGAAQDPSKMLENAPAVTDDLEFDALELDKPQTLASPKSPTYPTNPTNPSGSLISPLAHGVAFIPISVSRSTDAADNRSRLPAHIVRDWQQQLGRTVTRMELRIDLTRRGLVLPVAVDDTLDALVLPVELANRLKLSADVTVWVGPG